ncbi:hypothetical protein F5Y09DRAFT_342644 [Xylaria sp. FL1042]|nr:hypothetical protein F5Y09DRAFT_342644 [Xylaria sp. FL1042]
MPIQETLEFRSDDFRQVVAKASTEWLRQQEVIATRKGVLSSFGVGVGVSGAVTTGGVSVLFAAYKTRSAYVAHRKLEIIQAELRKRNIELHKFSKSKDLLGPIAIGAVGVAVGTEITGLIDGITNIEQLGAGLPDGASPSTGLLDNPSEAFRGAEGAIEQIVGSITNDTSTTAAIATTDAVAYHAGMIQIQTVAQEIGQTAAEKLLFSPGEANPECRRSVGVAWLSCDSCKAKIAQGSYWHCCDCHGDNYDICQKCYDNNVRCTQSRHSMKKLQTPTGPDFVDKISATPGYGLWKPLIGSSISKSELAKKYLFRCNFCRAEVRQGKLFRQFLIHPVMKRKRIVEIDMVQIVLNVVHSTFAMNVISSANAAVTAAFAKISMDLTTTTFAIHAIVADLAAKSQMSMFCFSILYPTATTELDTPAPVNEDGYQRATSNPEAIVLDAGATSVQVLSFIVANALGTAQTTSICVCAVIEVGEVVTILII